MVDRNSQEAQFATGQAVQQQQSQVGAAQADPNKYATSSSIAAPTVAQSSGDRILEGIMNTAGKMVDTLGPQYIQKSHEEAYLQGQAAATTGQSEADLQGDVFTKDWATAGFRDTMGRIALSDNSSRITEDMPKLREMAPEKFSEYMDQRRAQLLPSLDGMSQQARKAVFSSMALDERTVFHQQAAEHRKFVWETQVAAIQSSFGAAGRMLDASKGSESPGADPTAAYTAATSSWLGTVHGLTVANPNVPIAARSQLIYEAARDALANNNQQAYERMKTDPMPDGQGGFTTLLDQLNSTDRAKLESGYRESLGRTQGARSLNALLDFGTMQAQWADPQTPLQPAQEVKDKIDSAFKSGFFGDTNDPSKGAAEKAAALWKSYSEAALKKKGKFESATAWVSGDVDGMRRAGKTRQESLDNWQEQYGRNMPLDKNVSTLVQASLANGQYEGLTLAGSIMQPAWTRLRTNSDVDPASAKLVAGTISALESATSTGHPAAMHAYLQSFDQDTQEMILGVQGALKAGASPTDAVLQTQAKLMENAKLDPTTRLALAGKRAEENAKIVTDSTSSNALGQLWGAATGLFSTNGANKQAFMVKRGLFENAERVSEAQGQVKFALAEELEDVSRNHPWADAGVREKMANAAVANRSTMTKWGPLIVPRGQTMQSYFGVKDTERVGEVLSSMVQPTNDDNRVTFQAGANGELLFKEYTSSGAQARIGHLDPKTVAAAVQHARAEEVDRMNVLQGQGKTVTVSGIPINYSGSNSLGIDPVQMFDLRSRLIKHEGVSADVKDDIGGQINKKTNRVVQTGGVGLSDTNDAFPKLAPGQKMTPDQISVGLRDSSEAAAKIALNWQVGTHTQGNANSFQLFSELAFQGGGYNKAYNGLIVAVRNRDYNSALAALKETPSYKMAGDGPRRKFYVDTLGQLLKD